MHAWHKAAAVVAGGSLALGVAATPADAATKTQSAHCYEYVNFDHGTAHATFTAWWGSGDSWDRKHAIGGYRWDAQFRSSGKAWKTVAHLTTNKTGVTDAKIKSGSVNDYRGTAKAQTIKGVRYSACNSADSGGQ